jgi:hypothetical protein
MVQTVGWASFGPHPVHVRPSGLDHDSLQNLSPLRDLLLGENSNEDLEAGVGLEVLVWWIGGLIDLPHAVDQIGLLSRVDSPILAPDDSVWQRGSRTRHGARVLLSDCIVAGSSRPQ